MTTIDGASGANTGQLGGYGRNAATNMINTANQLAGGATDIPTPTGVRYSPNDGASKPDYANAFGMAETFVQQYDTNKDGKLSLQEVNAVLTSYNIKLSESRVQTGFNAFDRNGDGEIDMREAAAGIIYLSQSGGSFSATKYNGTVTRSGGMMTMGMIALGSTSHERPLNNLLNSSEFREAYQTYADSKPATSTTTAAKKETGEYNHSSSPGLFSRVFTWITETAGHIGSWISTQWNRLWGRSSS